MPYFCKPFVQPSPEERQAIEQAEQLMFEKAAIEAFGRETYDACSFRVKALEFLSSLAEVDKHSPHGERQEAEL